MKLVKIIAAAGALLIAVALGAAIGAPSPETALEPTTTPAPSLQPEPTPLIVTETETVEVEVVPAACERALRAGERVIVNGLDFEIAVLSAYVDFPDEDLTEFGRRVETLVGALDPDTDTEEFDHYMELAAECVGS